MLAPTTVVLPRLRLPRLQPALPRPTMSRIAAAASLLLGLAVWAVHRPGIANHDGLEIYAQAVGFIPYSDFQPIYLSLLVSGLLSLGATFAALTLAQSLLVCLGVQRLAAGAARTAGASDRAAHAAGLATLLLLLLPVTPLAWYLVYFGSDGFLLVAFVWLAAVWLDSHRRFPHAGPAERAARAAALTALAGAALLIRPNTLALLPVFAAMLFALHGRGRWRAALACCLVLLAVRPAAGALAYRCFAIERSPPIDPVMAHDLVGIAIMRPEALAEMPFTSASLVGDRYRTGAFWGDDPLYPWTPSRPATDPNARFVFGVVDPFFDWWGEPIVKPGFARGGHERLAQEYWRTVRRYPGTLALVKLRGFIGHFLDPFPYWHNIAIDKDPNAVGLAHEPNRPLLRSLLLAIDKPIAADPLLRMVSGRHVVWFAATVLAVLGLGYGLARRPGRPAAALFLVLLVPLGYYFSFLPATGSTHFRYMYPATLLTQAVLTALGVNLARRVVRACGGAPGGNTGSEAPPCELNAGPSAARSRRRSRCTRC